MSIRHFHLRLQATYEDDKNSVGELLVEVEGKSGWEVLDLDVRAPGFLLFIYGIFSCQHLYMRTNCAECNLLLKSAEGELRVEADENWIIQHAEVSFQAELKSGQPSEKDIAYIKERMHHCPVSSNLPVSLRLENRVIFS